MSRRRLYIQPVRAKRARLGGGFMRLDKSARTGVAGFRPPSGKRLSGAKGRRRY